MLLLIIITISYSIYFVSVLFTAAFEFPLFAQNGYNKSKVTIRQIIKGAVLFDNRNNVTPSPPSLNPFNLYFQHLFCFTCAHPTVTADVS